VSDLPHLGLALTPRSFAAVRAAAQAAGVRIVEE
jgi:hypothetical protein